MTDRDEFILQILLLLVRWLLAREARRPRRQPLRTVVSADTRGSQGAMTEEALGGRQPPAA